MAIKEGGFAQSGRTIILFCVLIAFLLLPIPCRAALQFDVFLGFDGIVREANWFPVVCEIHDDGPGFDGIIEISGDTGSKKVERLFAVELPTGTRKRVCIPVFASMGNYASWTVRLLDSRGRIRAEQKQIRARHDVAWDGILLGAMTQSFGGLPRLPEAKVTQMQPQVARFVPPQFPDNAISLEGMTTLYLHAARALELKPAQAEALLAWMNGGGHLIVSTDQPSDYSAVPWLASWLPATASGLQTMNVSDAFHRWITDTNAIGPDKEPMPPRGAALSKDVSFSSAEIPVTQLKVIAGKVVLQSGATPLVVSVSHGFGTLTMLGFNPERETFRSWRHAPWFWARIINTPGGWFVEQKKHHYGGVSADGVFGVLLDTDQVQKLPVSSLLCLLIFYLLLIGPVDRLWLKRINRTMLTWITFPLYVLGFSLLIYWIGFALRSGILEWNELHVVDVLPSGQEAMLRGRSYASFYSPYSRNYTLHSTTPSSSIRTEFMGRESGGVDPFRAVIQQRNDGYDAKLSMAVWTSEMLVEEWHLKGKPPLRVSGDWRTKDVSLSLQNQVGRTLKEVSLVIQGRIYTVGEIKAGETREIQLAKLGSSTLPDYVRNQGGQIYERAQQRTYAFGHNSPKAPENAAQIAIIGSFLSQIEAKADNYSSGRFFISPQGLDLSPLAAREDLLVFAWDAGTSPVKSAPGFEIPRRKQDTLWRMVLARPTP